MVFTGTGGEYQCGARWPELRAHGQLQWWGRLADYTDDQGIRVLAERYDTDTVIITVTQSMTPPVNTVPAAQTTAEDTASSSRAATVNQISISDLDIRRRPGADHARFTNGTLTLNRHQRLSFSTGTGDG